MEVVVDGGCEGGGDGDEEECPEFEAGEGLFEVISGAC